MPSVLGLEANDLLLLCVKTLAITFVGRFVLDAATSWIVDEMRPGVVASVLIGWCAAVIFGGALFAGGLGVISALVACAWHVAGLLRERAGLT